MAASLTLDKLISLIILLIIVIFVGMVYFYGYLSAEQAANRASCQTSIALNLLTSQPTRGVTSIFDLYCPRKIITIGENSMEHTDYAFFESLRRTRNYMYDVAIVDGGALRIRSINTPPTPDALEQAAKDIISYELSECWDLFREGQVEILRSQTDTWVFKSNTCIVCAEIQFNRQFFPEVLNLEEHFESTYTHRSTTRPLTLEEYLFTDRQPSTSLKCLESFPSFDQLVLQPDDTYAIVFFRTGRRFGGLSDESNIPCQAVGVIPTQNLGDFCEVMVN